MHPFLLVLLICLAAWAAFWITDQSGLPDPPRFILKAGIALVALFALFKILAPLAGI